MVPARGQSVLLSNATANAIANASSTHCVSDRNSDCGSDSSSDSSSGSDCGSDSDGGWSASGSVSIRNECCCSTRNCGVCYRGPTHAEHVRSAIRPQTTWCTHLASDPAQRECGECAPTSAGKG